MRRDDIGAELKAIRLGQGLTRAQVSEKTLYSIEHIAVMENKSEKISIKSLTDLLDFYGYEMDFKKILGSVQA